MTEVDAPPQTRRLFQGSEVIARSMIAAGCRFFAGYPMTPFTEVLEQMAKRFAGVTPLAAEDIAGAILYAIGQPPNVSVNEVLVRPSGQGA